jgi:hypothetical protein
MNKYIIKLLKLESTVIIPNFGALMKSGKSLIFNSILKYNDQKLEKFIAKQENMELQDVANALAKYVREINAEIEKGGQFLIVGIGSFYKAENGKVALKIDESTIEENSSEKNPITELKKETIVTSLYKEKPVKNEASKNLTENDLIKSVSSEEEEEEEEAKIEKNLTIKEQPILKKEIEKTEEKTKVIQGVKKTEEKPILKKEIEKTEEKTKVIEEVKKTEEQPILKKEVEKTEEKPILKKEIEKTEEKTKVIEEVKKTEEQPILKKEVEKTEEKPILKKEIEKTEEKTKVIEEVKKTEEQPILKKEFEKTEEKTKVIQGVKKTEEKPILKKEIEKTEEKTKVIKEKKKRKGVVWLRLLFLILFGGGAYVALNLKEVKSVIGLTKSEKKQEITKNTINESTKESDPEQKITFVDSTEEYDDTTNLKENFIENEIVTVIDINENEEVIEKKSTEINEELIYHVIVGAFGSELNAIGLVEKLKKEGFNTAKIVGKSGSLHKVAASSHATKQEANDAVEKAKSINEDAFVEKK